MEFSFPSARVGQVIGKSGSNIGRLRQTYRVEIVVPDTSRSEETTKITIRPTSADSNVEGCYRDIMSLLQGIGGAVGGPVVGGAGEMGMRVDSRQLLVFVIRVAMGSFQLLLQHKNSFWRVPYATLDDAKSTGEQVAVILSRSCSMPRPGYAPVAEKSLPKKHLCTVALYPDADMMQWAPRPADEGKYTDAPLALGGVPIPVVTAHAWVDLCQLALTCGSIPDLHGDVVKWMHFNGANMLAQVAQLHQIAPPKFTPPPVGPPKPALQVVPAAATPFPPPPPGWSADPANAWILVNARAVMGGVAAFSDDMLRDALGTMFHPQALTYAFAVWKGAGGSLPGGTGPANTMQ